MKYLIVSDIHGSLPALESVLDVYDREHCDMLLLLGDILNYGPRNRIPEGIDPKGIAQRLNAMKESIVAVRGNCDSEVDQMLLHFPIMQTYTLLVDEGRKILLTHGHVYSDSQLPPGDFDAAICGHTHLWHLERMGATVGCNTGSITFPKGGNPPTLGTMDRGLISIFTLEGQPLKRLQF